MSTTALPPERPPYGVTARLAEAARILVEVQGTLWAAQSPGELTETVAMTAQLKAQSSAIALAAIGELEATNGVAAMGWASTKEFVTAVEGGHKGSGPMAVRLARNLAEPAMAPVAEAHRDGWLSTVKVNVIDRSIDALPRNPDVRARAVQLMLDAAKAMDASDLRTTGRQLLAKVDPEGDERREEKALDREERSAHLGRELSITDDGLGGARIRGRCSSEDALTIKNALLPLSKPQPAAGPTCDAATCEEPGCSHDGRDPRDHGARMLDALVEACQRLASADLLPDSHGARPRVSVLISYEDLCAHLGDTWAANLAEDVRTPRAPGSPFGLADTGENLAPSTVRRLACDADVIPIVLGRAGEVLDVGRHQRLATAAIWRALVARDGHCRFPSCTRPPFMCHAHHLVHWADGGPTSLENLVLLCGHHHRLVHAAPWTITQPKPGLFQFTPPDAVRRSRGVRADVWSDRAPPDDWV